MTRRNLSTARAVAAVVMGATVLLACAAPLRAVIVHHDSTLVFYDSFENMPVNSEPTGSSPGTWHQTSANTRIWTAATDPTTPVSSHPTRANSGTNYLRVIRPTGYTLEANLGTAFTSGVVKAEFAMYIPSTASDFPIGIAFTSVLGPAPWTGSYAWIDTKASDNNVYLNNGSTTVLIPGITYVKDAWQMWEMAYTLVPGAANDTWTVTVNGVTSAPILSTSALNGAREPNGTAIQYLSFRGDGNGTVFLDLVPEPASAVALALVGGLCVSRRRRRR